MVERTNRKREFMEVVSVIGKNGRILEKFGKNGYQFLSFFEMEDEKKKSEKECIN